MLKDNPLNPLPFLVVLSFVLALIVPAPAALAQAFLESPQQGSFESGIGLIRGWVCTANSVEVVIDQGTASERRLATAYPSRRQDTQSVCGDSDNGFGLTVPWYAIGDGLHNLRALADGVEFANVNFVVTTLGSDFLTGINAEFPLSNFPSSGNTTTIGWSEPHQNFVLKSNVTIPTINNPPSVPRTFLESPRQGSFESGIGLIRGWVCEASAVEVVIDQGTASERRLATAYPSRRQDTEGVCGDSDNGFGLTVPWYAFGNGVHNLRALADGLEFANVNFAVTALGSDFLTGLSGDFPLADFPGAGNSTTVRWSEPHQNFIIASSTATGDKIATVAAVTDLLNPLAVIASDPRDLATAFGVRVDKASDGSPTRLDAIDWRSLANDVWLRLILSPNGLPSVYRDSRGLEARFTNYTDTTVDVSFFDGNGQLIAGPLSMPISRANLGHLEDLAGQIGGVNSSRLGGHKNAVDAAMPKKFFAQGWPVVVATEDAATAVTLSQFSLSPLSLEMVWSGGVALEETLCALTGSGVANLVAGNGCAAPVVAGFAELSDAPQGGTDPAVQRLLRLSRADVNNAPCSQTGDDPTACLSAAAEALEDIEAPAPDDTFDLTGAWTGTAQSTAFPGCNARLELNFTQTGNQLSGSGTATVTQDSPEICGPGDSTSGQLSGSVNGNQINAGLASNTSGTVSYTGTIAADGLTIAGNYSAPSVGDSGTWQVTQGGGNGTPTVPATPRNVSASDGTYTDRVSITWGVVSNATSYEVYRSDSSTGGGTRIGQTTTAVFADSTVTAGVTHWYSVKACNSAGCSNFSTADAGYRATSTIQEARWGALAGDLCCTGSSSTLAVTVDGVTRRSSSPACGGTGQASWEGFATTSAGSKSFSASVTASACATLNFSGNVNLQANNCYIFQSNYENGPVLAFGSVSCTNAAAQPQGTPSGTSRFKTLGEPAAGTRDGQWWETGR
jgi:hypothetical protein